MKRVLALCLVLIFLGLLLGCVERGRETVYITGDIECEVSWTIDKTTYRAKLERREDFTRIYFFEPRALSGLLLVQSGEGFTATLDGIEIEDAPRGLFEITKFFEYDTRVLSSSLEGGLERLELERADGEKFSLLLDGGAPTKIYGELYGERREIKIICVDGNMAGG